MKMLTHFFSIYLNYLLFVYVYRIHQRIDKRRVIEPSINLNLPLKTPEKLLFSRSLNLSCIHTLYWTMAIRSHNLSKGGVFIGLFTMYRGLYRLGEKTTMLPVALVTQRNKSICLWVQDIYSEGVCH